MIPLFLTGVGFSALGTGPVLTYSAVTTDPVLVLSGVITTTLTKMFLLVVYAFFVLFFLLFVWSV